MLEGSLTSADQKPELVAAQAQITHSQRKLAKQAETRASMEKNVEHLRAKVANLEKELRRVKKDAEDAAGKHIVLALFPRSSSQCLDT